MMPITEADLHAYVDGELSPARRADVEAHLAGHPDAALRVRAWQEQKHAVQRLFEPVLDEPIPPALEAAAVPPGARQRGSARPALRIAAGVMLALLGGMAGWWGHGRYQASAIADARPSLPQQAAIAHAVYSPDVRRPVEIGADQETQLVTWLSRRLGQDVRAPKLGSLGFELVGGRLLPGSEGPVAQFMYQDAGGQRLTLYVSTERDGNPDTAFRFAREGGINVFYWIDGPFGYALSAGVSKDELARVASAVYDQLDKRLPHH